MIERLKRNEKAVSPVIGVILMVAITVILAAVIASFVFGMGAKAPKTAPQAQLALSDANDQIGNSPSGQVDVFTITHNGGDSIACSNIKIFVYNQNELIDTLTYSTSGNFTGTQGLDSLTNFSSDDRFDPGEIMVIYEDVAEIDPDIVAGDVLQIKVMDTLSNQPILDGQVQVW